MTTIRAAQTAPSNGVANAEAYSWGRLWQVPTFVVGMISLILVAAAAPMAAQVEDDHLAGDLAAIRKALDKPGVPNEDVLALADSTVARTNRQPQRAGEAHFLLGSLFLRKAENTTGEAQRTEREKAAMHLEWAELRGVSPQDVARLTFLRGKLAYIGGGSMPRAIELFNKSLPGGAADPAEGYGLLAKAYMFGPAPDLEAALAAVLKQMEHVDDDALLAQVRLAQADLLLRLGRRGQAIVALQAIGGKAPLELQHKARLLQASTAMEEAMWGRAIMWWNELLASPQAVPGGKGRILYNLGWCWANYDPPAHDHEAAAAWGEARYYGGDEAQAASLRLAEMRLHSPGQAPQALAFFQQALEKVSGINEYNNSLLAIAEARELLELACGVFDELEDNDHFLQAAELLKKLAPAGVAEERIGQAAEAKGHGLLLRIQQQPEAKDRLFVQARDAFQKAALAYEQAAENRSPLDRIDALWRSIECLGHAQKHAEAIAMLRRFVELPAPAHRKAQAWFTLAEIQRAHKQPEAWESYKHCVAFNNDAFTARALLQLADLARSQNNHDEARDVLLQIKAGPDGRIADRASHEQALVKLAELFFQDRQYEKAALECKEFIKHYPASAAVWNMREHLGRCYRRLADEARAKANPEPPDVVTSQQKDHYQQRNLKNLELARDTFQQLADDLETLALDRHQELKTLTRHEDGLRRNALLEVADCYFEMPSALEVAYQRYNSVFERFSKEREGFWAAAYLYHCACRAANAKVPDVQTTDVICEAAERAIEHCLQHFDQYDRTGAFNSPQHKDDCRAKMETAVKLLRARRR